MIQSFFFGHPQGMRSHGTLFFGHPQGMPLRVLLFVLALAAFSCDLEDPATPGLLVPKTVDQDATLPSLAINGTLLHVETYGKPSDPILVLIHGGPGGDYRSLLPAKAMAQEGFFVIFYDQRGTGLSQRVSRSQFEGADAIQLMIEDLDQLIRHFKKGPNQKVFLMGHSWGAMLATAYINQNLAVQHQRGDGNNMLATAYINQNPEAISGAVLAEPGGFTWAQTSEYLSRSNKIKLFSEALNDAVYPEQIFSGRDEHETLDYKASFFASFENAPGNTIGNAGPYPFWRNGAVAFNALIDNAESRGLDFTTHLKVYKPKVLFLYSELNRAYQLPWAQRVSSAYTQAQLEEIKGCGHEMFHFAWPGIMTKSLSYLNALK